jgi:hypothetical protein
MAFISGVRLRDRSALAGPGLPERKELIAKYVSAEIQAIHARTVDALNLKHLLQTPSESGRKRPRSAPIKMEALSCRIVSKGPLVVCFIQDAGAPSVSDGSHEPIAPRSKPLARR